MSPEMIDRRRLSMRLAWLPLGAAFALGLPLAGFASTAAPPTVPPPAESVAVSTVQPAAPTGTGC